MSTIDAHPSRFEDASVRPATREATLQQLTAVPVGAKPAFRGEAAERIAKEVGFAAREWTQAARPGAEVYRLVAPADMQQGLADGTYRWAKATKGDASVQIKSTADGVTRRNGELARERPKAAKAIGPVAWQALACVTQQHFLAEIDVKLRALDGKLGELLWRDEDRDRGRVEHARDMADSVLRHVAEGNAISRARWRELADRNAELDQLISVLSRRAKRATAAYRSEGGSAAPDAVIVAYVELHQAIQALRATSAALVSASAATADEQQLLEGDEDDRLRQALSTLGAIRQLMIEADAHWDEQNRDYLAWRRLPRKDRVRWRIANRTPGLKPPTAELDRAALQLEAPSPDERGLIIARDGGGEVVVYAG